MPGVIEVPLGTDGPELVAPVVARLVLGALDARGRLVLRRPRPGTRREAEEQLRWGTPEALPPESVFRQVAGGGAPDCLALLSARGRVRLLGARPDPACGMRRFLPGLEAPPLQTHGVLLPGAPGPLQRVVAGRAHVCALDAARRHWCWGPHRSAELGLCRSQEETASTAPVRPPIAEQGEVALVAAGGRRSCVVGTSSRRRITCWGERLIGGGRSERAACATARDVEDSERSRPGGTGLQWRIEARRPVEQIVLGERFGCARLRGGQVRCWGENGHGELGVSLPKFSASLAAVVPLPGPATELVAGAAFACAALRDGSVWCWGDGRRGQLGPKHHGARNPKPRRIPLSRPLAPLLPSGASVR